MIAHGVALCDVSFNNLISIRPTRFVINGDLKIFNGTLRTGNTYWEHDIVEIDIILMLLVIHLGYLLRNNRMQQKHQLPVC